MSNFRLITLGGCRIEDSSGAPIEFPAGKPLALLVSLAVRSEPQTRRELARLLWSRKPGERGLHSLRQALWLIRKKLGEDVLDADDAVALRPGSVVCDAVELEAALAQGRLDAADELWNGEFLHRFTVADAPEWDRWVYEFGDSLAGRLAAGLRAAAMDQRNAGNGERARHYLQRAIDVCPDEPRYRDELITFLVESRDQRAAEAALAAARQAFADPEQKAALERLESRVERLRDERASSPQDRLDRPDLVGRSSELADLRAAWRRTQRGQTRLVLVTGPAGIGKTRLVEDFARTIEHEDAFTVRIRATEAERSLEYGVVASLIRALLPLPGAAGISTASDALLRGLAPSLPARGVDHSRNAEVPNAAVLADALTDLIGAVAYEHPFLVTLDDADWADAASVTVLARAMRTLREGAVMAVFTARTTDGVDSALRPLASLGGPIGLGTIRLRPLTRAETETLVAVLIELPDGVEAPRLVGRIHATAGGNPFHVIQLLHALLDDGLISASGDHLILDTTRLSADPPWPATVRTVIRQRLERLSPRAREVAYLLATVTPHEPEVAARRIAGVGRSEYARSVAELIEHGIARWDGTTLAFTHDEVRVAAAVWDRDEQQSSLPRRNQWIAAAAVLLIATTGAVALVRGLTGLTTDAAIDRPYGGGVVLVAGADTVLAFTPSMTAAGVEWTSGPPPFEVPPGDRLRGPFRTAYDTMWFRATRSVNRGPDIMRIETGTWVETPVIARPFDDVLHSVSPDGSYITFGSAPSFELHDLGLHMARIDGSEARVIRTGVSGGFWSRDGRYLLTIAETPQADSLLVLTPRGTQIASLVDYRIIADWCGSAATVLVAVRRPEAGFRLLLWNVDRNEVTTVAEQALYFYDCSPDGSAILVQLLRDGQPQFGVLTTDGDFHGLDIVPTQRFGRGGAVWIPDRVAPVPVTLSVTADTVMLDWGASDALTASVLFSDGSDRDAPVDWMLADSTIASVSAGRVTANRPGRTLLTACVHDWICDTAVLDISGEQTEAVLFHDDFEERLSAEMWTTFGNPVPVTAVAGDSESVLFLHGDGIWADGVISRQGFAINLGATLDLEFRLPLTGRVDRQRLNFCLGRFGQPSGSGRHFDGYPMSHILDGACIAYPAEELRHFNPAMVNFYHAPVNFGAWAVATGFLPSDDWTQLTIQVLPDGTASLFLGRQHIADLPTRLEVEGHDDWRIYLAGHSVDTHLEVRHVTLLSGARY